MHLLAGWALLVSHQTSVEQWKLLAPAVSPEVAETPEASPTQVQDINGRPLPLEVQGELSKEFSKPSPEMEREASEDSPAAVDVATTGVDGEVLVQGKRPRGSVIGDVVPERTFSPLDIDAYGASNIKELLQALGSQIGSSKGSGETRPITLLNGRRVSGFAEIAEIPAEAIERMDVFPEEVALRYGYRADQKVVNIVTFERFRSDVAQLGAIAATQGGYGSGRLQGNHFAIAGATRFDLGFEFNRATSVRESERNLIQAGSGQDEGQYRTLLPATDQLIASALVSGSVLNDLSYTVNGRFEKNDSQDLIGRLSDRTLRRDRDVRSAKLGTTLHGESDRWSWTLTGAYENSRTNALSSTKDGQRAEQRARSIETLGNINLLLNGPIAQLPAGPFSSTIRATTERRVLKGLDGQPGDEGGSRFARNSNALQLNLNAPILARRLQRRNPIGSLSAYANAEIERLSDLGSLLNWGFGMNWSPVKGTSFTASMSLEQNAPALEQLGAPQLISPGYRFFDFSRGETIDALRRSGGNPGLAVEKGRISRIGWTTRPFAADLTLNVDYISSRVRNPIFQSPILRPEFETAFPDRFERDAEGRLVQVDERPINFARARQKQLRWGVSFVRPLGSVEPFMQSAPVRTYSSEAEARAAAPPGAMVAMVQPGSAMARRFEDLSSRLNFSFNHTWQLQDRLLLQDGGAELDLLKQGGFDLLGGTRRHRIELQAGLFKKGLGARMTFNWQSGIDVRNGSGLAGDLRFAPLSTLDLLFFANIADRLGRKGPDWAKGLRATVGITNLFDTKPKVTNANGPIPFTYQAHYLNPIGRTLSLTLRKAFRG